MQRLVAYVLALAALALVVLLGGFSSGSGESSESSRITDYVADFTVGPDGDLQVVETLTVSFPVSRHGIFRFFDTRDPNDDNARLVPQDISVSRDGQSESFEVLEERRGRFRNIKIGSEFTTIVGEHTYVIRYSIPTVLLDVDDRAQEQAQFYWDLVPAGWVMPIERSSLTVHLPASPTTVQCAIGQGAIAGCTGQESGNTVRIETGPLAPNTPVTLQAGIDQAAPERAGLVPWPQWLDPILSRSPVPLAIVVLAGLLAAVLGARLTRSTIEKPPGFPLMYAPPEGVGPAQAAYILDERVEDEAYVASLMHAAENGAITLDQQDRSWTIAAADPASWSRVDPVTRGVGQALGVESGGAFTASRKDVQAGQQLKSALSSFKSDVRSWATGAGLMTRSGLGPLGGFMILVPVILAVFLGLMNPFGMSMLAIVPGLFAVFGLGVAFSGAGTRRTPAGRELWSRVGGFHRILSTPSSVDRFDFSGRKELYTAYLPWAVAFGCADEWAKKYRTEVGTEPPVPVYFGGYGGAHSGNHVNQMVGSFNSTVQGAISSYQATQQSSGSGGGGFSGGGGGGGGGGGSW